LEEIIKEEIKLINFINGKNEKINLNSDDPEKKFILKNGIFTETKFLQKIENKTENTDGK